MSDEKKLTDKQEAFINEYLIDLNATRAAIAAGYSEATAKEMGYENLTKPHIMGKIKEVLGERALASEEVLARLSEIARFDVGDYLDDNGFIDSVKLKKNGSKFIKKIKLSKDGIEYHFHDMHDALKDLGRYHVLFTDKVSSESTVKEDIEVRFVDSKPDEEKPE